MKTATPDFVSRLNTLRREAIEYIRTSLEKTPEISFGTEEELRDDNFVLDSLPHISVYDNHGFNANDYAVASISKKTGHLITLKVLGLGDNYGSSEEICLSDASALDNIYLAQAIADIL